MKFSGYGNKKAMFQTTNQKLLQYLSLRIPETNGHSNPPTKSETVVQDGQIHWVNLPPSSDHGQQTRKNPHQKSDDPEIHQRKKQKNSSTMGIYYY